MNSSIETSSRLPPGVPGSDRITVWRSRSCPPPPLRGRRHCPPPLRLSRFRRCRWQQDVVSGGQILGEGVHVAKAHARRNPGFVENGNAVSHGDAWDAVHAHGESPRSLAICTNSDSWVTGSAVYSATIWAMLAGRQNPLAACSNRYWLSPEGSPISCPSITVVAFPSAASSTDSPASRISTSWAFLFPGPPWTATPTLPPPSGRQSCTARRLQSPRRQGFVHR